MICEGSFRRLRQKLVSNCSTIAQAPDIELQLPQDVKGTYDLASRRGPVTAALGFALLDTKGKPAPPEVQTVRKWLDNWKGLGHVVTGMHAKDSSSA